MRSAVACLRLISLRRSCELRAASWRALSTATASSSVSEQTIPSPSAETPESASDQQSSPDDNYSPKVHAIVDEITRLSLLEVADLNSLLKKTLNLPDMSAMPVGMPMGASTSASPSASEATDEPVTQKTSFTVKLMEFDATKKIGLIKAIKAIVPGLNLVQAKKFVEGAPQVVKADVGQSEADELKKQLTDLGGTIEID